MWLTSTASMRGRSSNRIPGGRCLFGPANETGEHRSDQIGSVRTFTPSIWISIVAWFTNVTLSLPPSTRSGGFGPGGASTHPRQRPGSRVSRHLRNDPSPWRDSSWL